MKRVAQIIRDHLSFNRREQRGTIILAGLIILVNVIRQFIPDSYPVEPSRLAMFDEEIRRFEASLEAVAGSDTNAPVPVRSSTYFVLELNRADTMDLQRLRGIGPAFARRITGYRDRLGGFFSVDQLLEVYGMDSARFLGIRRHLTVDTAMIRRINLNSATFKELIHHPYMPFELAKEIATYRKRHKGIRTMEELRGMVHLDSALVAKLTGYLCLE